MAIVQLNSRFRWVIVMVFFASLLIAALVQGKGSRLLVAMTSFAMLTIPCGQRFINRRRWAWIGRQIYFTGLAVAWAWCAWKSK